MIIDNNSQSLERAICEGRHSDAELECKRLLTQHNDSGKPDNMMVVTWLHNLAQSLEEQAKYAEGLDTRLRARDMLISLMFTS